MCKDCGCETALDRAWHHEHEHHEHAHHEPEPGRVVELHTAILARNDAEAATNRAWFAQRGVDALNLMSSPGSGKTALLERTLRERGARWSILTLVGDQATDHDAARLRAAGGRAVPITTHSACHLDAPMVHRALHADFPPQTELLFIENVGNLVCPAAFDLGETARVALLSPPEGEDKPVKYPVLFDRADLVVLSKIDLEQPCGWDRDACLRYLRMVNPTVPVIALSARTGEGMDAWYDWLEARRCA